MNHLPSVSTELDKQGFFTDALTNVLNQLSRLQENSCLQIIYNSTNFFIHFNEGKLIYATNSVAPFERFKRHLRRLSNKNPNLKASIVKQLQQDLPNDLKSYTQFPSDYQGIIWLLDHGHLQQEEAITLLRRITREVFESFLCLPDTCQYKFVPKLQQFRELCQFDFGAYTQQCQKRLHSWQVFAEKIWSSYQRPYLIAAETQIINNLTAEQNETIGQLLKGLNFRQISAILDVDELVIAKLLYPSILDKTIIVRDPRSPFEQLPALPHKTVVDVFGLDVDFNWQGEDSEPENNAYSQQTFLSLEEVWKVAYVDDEQSVHSLVEQYLDPSLFSTITIDDAMEAFSKLIEFQPDLIFLDVNMPQINGYELCTLLRNHRNFKTKPIIMLSEGQGIINTTKFRLAGATDSLVKPFNRTQMLNIIFKYLQ